MCHCPLLLGRLAPVKVAMVMPLCLALPLADSGEPRSGPTTTFQAFHPKPPCLVIYGHVLVLPPSIEATLS